MKTESRFKLKLGTEFREEARTVDLRHCMTRFVWVQEQIELNQLPCVCMEGSNARRSDDESIDDNEDYQTLRTTSFARSGRLWRSVVATI